jgi:hypothetical protein
VKGDIGKYIKAIGIKSGELLDTAKIKLEIGSLKRQRDDEFKRIGSIMYKMYLKDKFDDKRISEICKAITKIEEEIKDKEKEIEKVHENAGRMLNKKFRKGSTKYSYKYKDDVVEAESVEIEPWD